MLDLLLAKIHKNWFELALPMPEKAMARPALNLASLHPVLKSPFETELHDLTSYCVPGASSGFLTGRQHSQTPNWGELLDGEAPGCKTVDPGLINPEPLSIHMGVSLV